MVNFVHTHICSPMTRSYKMSQIYIFLSIYVMLILQKRGIGLCITAKARTYDAQHEHVGKQCDKKHYKSGQMEV